MEKLQKIICTLIIPNKYYQELNNDIKEIFIWKDARYYTEFPADVQEESFLGEYIQAFCEVVLIINNPKYGITKECKLHTELLKLGQTEEVFSLLMNIQYKGSNKNYHDILVFQEVSQKLGYYTFELLGDQTVFSPE